MAVKIAAFLITLVVNIAAGIMILFTMLVAMNGYNESDAMWGLGVYLLLALLVAMVTGGGAALMVNFLLRKQFSAATSILISAPLFVVVGVGLEIVCGFIGVGIAELVRVNY